MDFRILPKVQPLFHEFLLIIIASYAELLELIITAVVNIEIYVAFNARQLAHIRMLPELPFALILNLVNIIVGYPVRIIIEDRRTQILLLEFIIGVDDRFNMILILYNMQPGKHITLEILHTLICRLMFNLQYRRQNAIRKMNLV